MALILRHCISSQKKRFAQEFRLFHHNVSSHSFINSNIKKCGSILHAKHFSTEDEKIHIYEGSLTKRIRSLKVISFGTTFAALITQPFVYLKIVETDNTTGLLMLFTFINFVGTFSPIYVHWLVRRYVTDIYYYPKEDKYVAEVFSFFKKKQIIFTSDDVDTPEVDSMMKNCTVHGYPLLFDEAHFTDPKYYCILMGYNDPIDFHMGPSVKHKEIDMKEIREKLKAVQKDSKRIEGKQ